MSWRDVWILLVLLSAPSAWASGVASPLQTNQLAAESVDELVYWRRSGEGWFWYQDPPAPTPDMKPVPVPQAPANTPPPEVLQMKELQRRLEEARVVAVMNPTEANVSAYLFIQKEVFQRSSTFADTWRRVVWTTPALDYAQRGRPTNNVALKTWDQGLMAQKEAQAASLARTHGLFFFFRGDCQYCHAAAPVLADFSRRYGLKIIAVSMDGSTLPEFPNAIRDAGQAQSLQVESVPALFLAKPGTRDIQPIGYGVLAGSDILDRIWVLTKTKPGESF